MPLLNYSTTIEAVKTLGQIQENLASHGAKAIITEYDDDGMIAALSFEVKTSHGELSFRLPVHPEAVLRILENQGVPSRFANESQAIRVAWRIVKNWVEAQMALLETAMVRMEEVFLPYLITSGGHTLYERMLSTQFQLPEGRKEER